MFAISLPKHFAIAALGAVLMSACGGSAQQRPTRSAASLRPPREASEDRRLGSELSTDGVLDRRSLIEAVLARNPSIQATHAAYRAASSVESQRNSLPDPILTYEFAPLSIFSDMRYGQTIKLSQRFPWPGKLSSQGEMAIAEAEAKQADYETLRLDLALVTSTLFDDWYAVERALELNRAYQELFTQLKRSAEAQYAAGRGSLADSYQAEVELAHLEHQVVVLESERDVIRARLNALLHRPPNAKLPSPPKRLDEDFREPAAWPTLAKTALDNRPELSAQEARIRSRQAGVRFADRQYYPDLTLMASYSSMWAQIEHQFMLGLSINLPLQRGALHGSSDEAQAHLTRTEHELSALLDKIRADVEQARLRLREAQHVVHLYKQRLLPTTRGQVEASLPSFQTGSSRFSEVMAAQKALLKTELEFHMAVAEVYRRRAQLSRALGLTSEEGVTP